MVATASALLISCADLDYKSDLLVEKPDDVAEQDYLEMIRLKTAVLLAASLKMGAMYQNPDVSMEQIEAILADFKERLTRNGHGL
ncbi:hypothetical protein D0T87_24270, partial [Bacteroides sp. 51]|nr:hypothetical protein [Bacteroides sp. 51]